MRHTDSLGRFNEVPEVEKCGYAGLFGGARRPLAVSAARLAVGHFDGEPVTESIVMPLLQA